ncbi:MAG: dockerin type I domain-containing protein, partial [Oscillospiraceae bacterium]|jgi:hypothetical protein|nr:dockerin type I domain-containing protein [Oscillospiraceae bacterium]
LLGECDISGPAAVWSDFSCDLPGLAYLSNWSTPEYDNTRWDLKLIFKGEVGQELFAISEFYLGRTKPGTAKQFEPKVTTGIAQNITGNSAVIVGSEFKEFDGEEILEAGILYSVDYYMSNDVYKKTAAPTSPFTVTLEDLQDMGEPFDVPFPVYIQYRAYVTTSTGTYLGGVRRFQTAQSGVEPRLELSFTVWNPPAAESQVLLTFEMNAAWAAEANVPWLDVSHAGGTRGEAGTFILAEENTSAVARIGTVTISVIGFANKVLLTKTITVIQAGMEGGDTPSGSKVIGKIKSYNPKNPITIRLLKNGKVAYTATIQSGAGYGQAEQSFTIPGVAPGTYSLVITKPAHTKFTVQTVVVGGEDVDLEQDGRPEVRLMSLLCGDINGDGMINNADLAILWMSYNYNRATGNASNPLCDLDGDGMVNSADLAILWMSHNYNRGEVIVP